MKIPWVWDRLFVALFPPPRPTTQSWLSRLSETYRDNENIEQWVILECISCVFLSWEILDQFLNFQKFVRSSLRPEYLRIIGTIISKNNRFDLIFSITQSVHILVRFVASMDANTMHGSVSIITIIKQARVKKRERTCASDQDKVGEAFSNRRFFDFSQKDHNHCQTVRSAHWEYHNLNPSNHGITHFY